jgi:hypothetical protein
MSINIRLTKINVIKAMPRAPILADDDLLSVALMYLFFVFVNSSNKTRRKKIELRSVWFAFTYRT